MMFRLMGKIGFAQQKPILPFYFEIPNGQENAKIDFKVRSVDNSGLVDASPALLSVPIKNTPPVIELNKSFSSKDTAFSVISVYWRASDPDGLGNLHHVELKINDGSWVNIDKKYDGVTLIPSSPESDGKTSASIYLDKDTKLGVQGTNLIVGDTNKIFIRSIDNSGSASEMDTISALFVKRKTSDLLLIGGDRSENNFYKEKVGKAYSKGFDFIDFATDDGKWQPAFWDPTFTLLLGLYDKVVFVSDKTQYLNANTGKQSYLMESSARSVQDYLIAGGKSLTIGFLQVDSTISQNSPIFAAYPIKTFSYSEGNPRLTNGSNTIIGKVSGYPDMEPDFLSTGVLPFYPSDDAEVIYTATLFGVRGWTGPDVIGARRKNGNNVNQVFIGLFMPDLAGQVTQLDQVFDHVLNTEFNW